MMGIWFVGERPLPAALLSNACALRACSSALAAIPVLPCPACAPASGAPSVLRPSAAAAAALWCVPGWLHMLLLLRRLLCARSPASLPLPACLFLCCAGNTIRTNLISTGAFEVSYEGVPIWSKVGAAARRGCCARGRGGAAP